MIRSKGEAGTGNIVEAVRHLRGITGGIRRLQSLGAEELAAAAKELQAPARRRRARSRRPGWLPVPLFCAGGIATPADAALDDAARRRGQLRRLGDLQVRGPRAPRPRDRRGDHALRDPARVAAASMELGEPMRGDDIAQLAAEGELLQHRGSDACWRAAGAARRERATLRVGVLASQGDFAAHVEMLTALGADAREVRTPADVAGLDALVIPGGESHDDREGDRARRARARDPRPRRGRRPMLGTCAGLIMCDREHLGLIDATRAPQRVRAPARELRGRPRDRGPRPRAASRRLHPRALDRAARPRGRGARRGRRPPGRRAPGPVLACAFHPELTDDSRLHALFMAMATASPRQAASTGLREGPR